MCLRFFWTNEMSDKAGTGSGVSETRQRRLDLAPFFATNGIHIYINISTHRKSGRHKSVREKSSRGPEVGKRQRLIKKTRGRETGRMRESERDRQRVRRNVERVRGSTPANESACASSAGKWMIAMPTRQENDRDVCVPFSLLCAPPVPLNLRLVEI